MTRSKEDAHALVADTASQRKSVRRKNSKSSSTSKKSSSRRVPKSEDSKALKEKYLEQPLPFPNNTKEDRTNADLRLSEFMRGERTVLFDGEEHVYDPNAMRTYTLEEVGTIMGVTRERVRQIEEAGIRKMWRAFDIMCKREGVSKEEFMGMLIGGNDEETVYMP